MPHSTATANNKDSWILSGSELSPFHLKVAAILKAKKIPFRDFPSQGNTFENLKIQIRLTLLKAGVLKLTYPEFTDYDEFPLVPFLFGPDGENLYDSSAIATWLDQHTETETIVKIGDDKKLHFLVQLIDEYFDEFGLYMVHHSRWKTSALDNTAGRRLANEMPVLIAPFRALIDNFFSHRQIRRLPYLFSVAPKDYAVGGLSAKKQPPSHNDFPATHDLLEQSYLNILNALEPIFKNRPYLFGERFTVADASLYGQLGMNLTDPSAAKWIEATAPNVFAWLSKIHTGDFSANKPDGAVIVDDLLKPLFQEIIRIFYPLMKQNEAAYEQHKKSGETQFNEAAFWRGKSLYRGELDGQPFASSAKSFQVKTWRQIKQSWNQLRTKDQAQLTTLVPGISQIE
ncbi:MAG: glutathione S-transferase family protein [Oleispira sp.]